MQQTIINGFQVMIFTGYHGTQLFINHPDGHTIYAHKVTGGEIGAMERARQIIRAEMPETVEAAAPVADKMICLSNRKSEFRAALKRGLSNDLAVYPDFEPDSFVVVNLTNETEYRVSLETREDGKNYGQCSCKDFYYRKNVCKHLSETLAETFFGVVESFGVNFNR